MTPADREPRIILFRPGGPMKSARISPGNYVATRLVAELADAWKESAENLDLTPGTISRQAGVIRRVGEFFTDRADRFLTLSGDGAEVARRLHDWESAMVLRHPPPSVHAKDLGMELRNHVARYLQSHGLFDGVLAEWASAWVLDGSSWEGLPLDEFSNDERLQLEQTCRTIVRDTEERLARGHALLKAGRDPRRYGWDRVENLLWALRNLPYDESFHVHLAGPRRALNGCDVDQESGVNRDARLKARPLITAVGAYLAPEDEYLLAVRVLLHLQTGWAPEESGRLLRSDIEFGESSVRVRATKLRAQRIRWHTLSSTPQAPWGWKAGDLIRRAADAMQHAHALSPDEPLFWVTGIRSARDRRDGEYPQCIIRARHFGCTNTLSKLIGRYGLSISEPHDMRRLRKTVKSARAALLGTLSGAAGDDHSVEVFRGHYAQTTTVHTIAAQTVLRAQCKVLERASSGPTFIDATAADVAAGRSDSDVAALATSVAEESPTEQQLTLSACRDPYDPPVGQTGSLCHASPSLCLQCRNAVIFRDHLPRLLVYRDVLDDIEKTMPPIQFSELYGQQRVNIDAVLTEFTTDHIEAARQQTAHLHRPLGQRAEQ
ncbi:hypothetical protein [Mycobacterium sp. 852002-10029_SCH5224772]|uniref:hypothetical protein n=1 Tax=Mycobacterium sp. 852002-10029_SCH5224772 TaxID=1834083 RepID=UPI0007FD0DFE|nr:hypothetical protein [Mycobacterium sp. 852002-10029_SCH5224772]OBE98997.1 hypothetical protein A5775_07620 [Mycobacterium sp. 852002-10029_SCH5224772]